MFKRSSPLKHKEEGHLILTEKAHKEAHGGEVTEDIPEPKDLTIYDSDRPKPPETFSSFDIQNILNQSKNEKVNEIDKKTDEDVDRATSFNYDPITSVSDQTLDRKEKGIPIVVGSEREGYLTDERRGSHWQDKPDENEYKRIDGVWTHIDPATKEKAPLDNSPSADEGTKKMISDLRFAATQKEFDINEPLTWTNKDENTLAKELQASDKYSGLNVQNKGRFVEMTLPNGKLLRTDPDNVDKIKA